MSADAARLARQYRLVALCSATLRALTGDGTLHYREGVLWRGDAAVDLSAPHLRPDPDLDDGPALRGMADAAAMRLIHSDSGLHQRIRPPGGVQALVFELLEQLRAESLAPAHMPGLRRNLRHRFESWSLAFMQARLADSESGLLLFAVLQLAWMRLTGWPLPEPLEGIMEMPRATLSPILGAAMRELRERRGDQAAYGEAAREVARRVAHLLDAKPAPARADASPPDARAARLAFTLVTAPADPAGKESGAAGAAAGDASAAQPYRDYRVHTRRYDVEVSAARLVRAAQLRALRDALDQRVAAAGLNRARLTRRLAAAMCAPREDGWSFEQETGRLDGRRLAQVVSSPAQRHVFRRPHMRRQADAAVTFLIDCSGSMKARIDAIAPIVDTLARALDDLAVPTEVLGYTTGAWHGGRARLDWLAQGRPACPGRLNEVCHLVFKEAGRSWRRARADIAALLKPDLFREGIDGEAVQWAAARLMQRDARRRLLVVVSDGGPMDAATVQANGADYLDSHLRHVVGRLEAAGRMAILAVGVGQDLTPYYRRGIALDVSRPVDTRLLMEVAEAMSCACTTVTAITR
ncbi:hypothetical protein AKI39_13640 [Bordetella sp. H567]|uniref:cobaltochelatase CobT-related protein n=1 Tax=Bordetella sp. H567 TaxID=1697043 RepID=UPI00081CA7C9|nr:hypothetical protein [Bordetella sp. H567]AOB31508.1 hypothetical protein AKI39_13640 [Bordetella sp. H567]